MLFRACGACLIAASIMLPRSAAMQSNDTQTPAPAQIAPASASAPDARPPVSADAPKSLVAHRGASAYAPEHTLAAYRLALAQGADYVEQDLALTKDGVLICLHDTTLDRTTNVKDIFPDRFVEEGDGAAKVRRWYANDFTLAEIKQLDAGGWFKPEFAGERVPTFQEAIDLVKGKAGLFPELKDPELYRRRGTSIVPPVLAILKKNGLDGGVTADSGRGGSTGRRANGGHASGRADGGAARPAIILQSFDEPTLRELVTSLPAVPRVFLIGGRPGAAGGAAARWLGSEASVREIAAFATGIGPAKELVAATPAIVGWAHGAGLTVTPYTFRSANTGSYKTVGEEMAQFLYMLGVDAVFTDNPDHFPRRR